MDARCSKHGRGVEKDCAQLAEGRAGVITSLGRLCWKGAGARQDEERGVALGVRNALAGHFETMVPAKETLALIAVRGIDKLRTRWLD